MGTLVMIAQFLLGLLIIVGLHELGHMLFAKAFGMRVESYSIGFPPKIFRLQWGETEYAIGAIPLGGAVKIAGMMDESLDTQSLSNTPQPWEFRAKPAWQRLIVMLGGILFNVISGLIIYIALAFSLGDTYLSKEEANKHGIVPNALGYSLGFREGDQIINIIGHDFEKFSDVLKPCILLTKGGYYTVLRDSQEVRIDIPANFIEKLSALKEQSSFIAPRMPFSVERVQKKSGAAQAGLQKGDQIVEVGDIATPYFHQLTSALEGNAGKEVTIKYMRNGAIHHAKAQVSETGKLGFQVSILLAYQKQNYGLMQAISVGASKAFEIIRINLIGLTKMLTGKVAISKSLSGPIGIAQIFGNQFNWINFWSITGFLSMVLAFTNLLPIPALDGGHALFLLYEIITGRRFSDKFLEVTQKVGMVILLLLIGYAIINDLYKLL